MTTIKEEDNPLVIIENFISEEDCDYLINTYKDKVVSSTVVGGSVHEARTSSTYFLPQDDKVIAKLRTKVAEYLKIPVENIEPIQFLRYKKGERYKYHHDFFKGENIGNQRVHTIIAYLNTLQPEDGGATSFWHYKQNIVPVKTNAVWFKNLNADGTGNLNSLHSGEEILKEDAVKYALNIWTRQSKY
jgi:prolyl 4-hydroxylase